MMKKIFNFFLLALLISAVSCQTRIVGASKPMRDNSLELYKNYTVRTSDTKSVKMQVLKVDAQNIYGKTKAGESVTIPRSDIKEVSYVNIWPAIIAGAAAVALVIFVPI